MNTSAQTASDAPPAAAAAELVEAPSAPLLGGRYRLAETLGRGGMADVLRARDTVLGRDVAVKIFHQAAALPDADRRRSAEVRLLAGLSHPGLVALYDAGRDIRDPTRPYGYLVMELVDGRTLAGLLEDGPLPPASAAAIGAQVAAALAYVHACGVVHRDVKPANVLVAGPADAPIAKLTDFGLARLLDSSRLTVDGTTIGTANYLSPEQATGAEISTATDVYSLGLLLLECLTDQVAYPGHGVTAALARLHRQPDVPRELPAGWRDLLTEMTAFDAAARPCAAEVARRLAQLPEELAEAGDEGGFAALFTEPDDDTPSRRRLSWLLAGAAATLLAVALAFTVIGGSGSPAAQEQALPAPPGSASVAAPRPAGTHRVAAVPRRPRTVAHSRARTAISAAPVARRVAAPLAKPAPQPSTTVARSHPAPSQRAASPAPPATRPGAGPRSKPHPGHKPKPPKAHGHKPGPKRLVHGHGHGYGHAKNSKPGKRPKLLT